MYSRSEWDRDQAKSADRAQKATDIRSAVSDKERYDRAVSDPNRSSPPPGVDFNNIKKNYK